MTRNLITELVIRLLAIWLIITSFGSLLLNIFSLKSLDSSFLLIICIFIILIILLTLTIIYSQRIAKLIWADRKTDEDIALYSKDNELFFPLIAIVGMYFIITSLTTIITELARIFIMLTSTSSSKEIYLYQIGRLFYPILLLLFGIITFCFPEKIMSMRFNIRKIFKREEIHWENVEEE